VYAPLIGYLNGRNRFGRQALLDVTFATLRTVGLVGFGYEFVQHGLSGVLGTTVGWVWAAAVIVPLAARSTGFGKALSLHGDGGAAAGTGTRRASELTPGVPTARAYLGMLLPIAGAQLCTNLAMQIDIALLGRFLSEGAAAARDAAELTGAERDSVKQWLAIYKECQTFAFLPYQLLFSITLVLFPMLARARADGDDVAVRAYVARGARLGAIFGGLLVSVIVALPASMLSFAYGAPDAARGADVLRAMALGQGAFAMLGIATTVLTSIGRERMAALVTLAAVVAVGVACAIVVPEAKFGQAQLLRSAQASAAALGVTLVAAGTIVRSRTGAFVPAATAARVLMALGGCVALGFVIPRLGRAVTPVAAAGVAVAYVALLVVAGEIGKADLALVRGVVRRKKR
jgi:stage V sporulation protein B